MLPGMGSRTEDLHKGTAKRISDKLHTAVSVRVSLIIIMLTITIPVLLIFTMQSPESDKALDAWPKFVSHSENFARLEAESANLQTFYAGEDEKFGQLLWDTIPFFDLPEKRYFPYELRAEYYFSEHGMDLETTHPHFATTKTFGDAETPNRRWNTVKSHSRFAFPHAKWVSTWQADIRQYSSLGDTAIDNFVADGTMTLWVDIYVRWNFTNPHQWDAGMNMVLIMIVMLLLVGFAISLHSVINKIVLKPLDELLTQVRQMAADMGRYVRDMAKAVTAEDDDDDEDDNKMGDAFDDDEEDYEDDTFAETEILERVATRIVLLHDVTIQKAGGEALDENVAAFTQTAVATKAAVIAKEEEQRDEEYLRLHRVAMMQAGLTLEDVESFEFNTLDLDDFQTYAAIIWFICGENMNLGYFLSDTLRIEEKRIGVFLEGISGRYINANPYHNWLHAVDVAHGTYQMMIMCKAKEYFSVADRFALLIAACCHDVGHPGLNNPFLVESDDPLALTYNDKSPLENLHSAIMFEYAYSNPQTAILHRCSKAIYMTIRKVAIEAILHTDMINHFPMVSELKLIHEDNPDVIAGMHEEFWNATLNGGSAPASDTKTKDAALNPVHSSHPHWELPADAVEFWNQQDKIATMRNLILHAADVSNPFKPFPICRAWAYLVLEEFFQQGDREKSLGLTVQLLNDRDKVRKCQSQIGFIEYVVCPLYFAFATIMPPINSMAENLINNCRQWEAELIEENTATQEEQDIIHQRIENIETNFHESQSIFEF